MAGDATAVNGESNGSGASSSIDADRAAFMARDTAVDVAAPVEKAAAVVVADDDSDLDDEGQVTTGDDDDLEESKLAGDDSGLDDEEEEVADLDTKKRLASVRRTDQRLREQRERQWKDAETALAAREAKLAERESKAPTMERLVERLRNPYEVGDVLMELGMSEDDAEAASQSIFARSKKFAGDPKAKETVARLKSERDLREQVASLKKQQEERDAADAAARKAAQDEQRAVQFIVSTAQAVTEKTPLAAALIEKNPARAQAVIAEITGRLMDETGAMPTPKQVIIALEKSRRQDLRDLGVDPKSITTVAAAKKQTSAATATATEKSSTTHKKAAVLAVVKPDEKKSGLTKDDFINRKFD